MTILYFWWGSRAVVWNLVMIMWASVIQLLRSFPLLKLQRGYLHPTRLRRVDDQVRITASFFELVFQAPFGPDKSWILRENGWRDWWGWKSKSCSEDSQPTLEWKTIEAVLKLPRSAENSLKEDFAQWNVWGAARKKGAKGDRKFKARLTFHAKVGPDHAISSGPLQEHEQLETICEAAKNISW
jgi:hypothetical protein